MSIENRGDVTYSGSEEIVAYGALKWRGRAVVSVKIYTKPDIIKKIGKFCHKCMTDGLYPELVPLTKRRLARYASELISGRKVELESLEEDKKDYNITYIPRLLVVRREEQPKLDAMLYEIAKSLPPEDKDRKEILKKRFLLNEKIISLSDGLSEEQLENLFTSSQPCEVDINCLDQVKRLDYLPQSDINIIESFRMTSSGKSFHPKKSENSKN
jgi:hypothetical protein